MLRCLALRMLTTVLFLSLMLGSPNPCQAVESPLSPSAIVASRDGNSLFIACAAANHVLVFDTVSRKIARSISVPYPPTGLALSEDGARLYVTCADATSQVCVVDASTGRVVDQLSAGHTAMSPVISRDGKTLFVCNRFNNDVSAIDLKTKGTTRRIAVPREPVAAGLSKDGRFLLVASSLPIGRADADFVSAAISVIDTSSHKVVKVLSLPIGGGMIHGLKMSPDGKFAVVTHLLSRFTLQPRTWIAGQSMQMRSQSSI
jgi:YVTN family beta-propeller protein